jgi:hypothetical protein
MLLRTLPLALLAVSLCAGSADKKLPIEKNSNEFVEIGGVLLDKDEVVKTFGSDLGGNIVVVRVTVRPLTEKPVRIDYDDFFLLDCDNGQRSEPYEPSQIAGTSALVVTPRGVRGGGTMGGPTFGGGLGPFGSGGGIGNSASEVENTTKVETAKDPAKPNPVLDALKANVLAQKEVSDTATGLLYFQIDGKKIKPKNLELHYKTPSGRMALRFRI